MGEDGGLEWDAPSEDTVAESRCAAYDSYLIRWIQGVDGRRLDDEALTIFHLRQWTQASASACELEYMTSWRVRLESLEMGYEGALTSFVFTRTNAPKTVNFANGIIHIGGSALFEINHAKWFGFLI